MTTPPVVNPYSLQQVNAPVLNSATGFVTIPTSASGALSTKLAPRAIFVTGAGNLGVKLADGTSNTGALAAVTAGMVLPLQVIQTIASNSAAVIGLR